MRRIAPMVCSLTLFLPALAMASSSKVYTGTVNEGSTTNPVSLTVTGNKVTHVSVTSFLSCSNGSERTSHISKKANLAIASKTHRFNGVLGKNPMIKIHGKVSGNTVTGALSVQLIIPNGGVVCPSGNLSYKATH